LSAKALAEAGGFLNDWMAMFVKIAKVALRDKREYLEKIGILARSGKTKAQRGASRKAAETRARKKAAKV